ncbi:MAG TPA: hypothetical protein VHR41_19685 [Gemmatimonadales bacterium]|jgi:hypothetical protein|nr:hypothetical protein [Gemmatimonadales bacterium]
MAKNLGRDFATMSEDERRRFALEQPDAGETAPEELDLEDPRDEDRIGRHYASPADEVADPDHRDGLSATLDDKQHDREVAKGARPANSRRRSGKR